MDDLAALALELVRGAVIVPALLLWKRGWWGRIATSGYVVVPPAASAYLTVTVMPPPLPWGWLPYGILLIWAANLIELLVETLREGVRHIWRRIRRRIRRAPSTPLPGDHPDPAP